MLDIRVTLRRKMSRDVLRRIPFARIAEHILGQKYELSLVVCGDDLAQQMNKKYRKKEYKPNVLSFPLDKDEGEIFLNVRKAEREAKEYDATFMAHLAYLYVHGCFHLRGLDHGAQMERLEEQVMKRFKLK